MIWRIFTKQLAGSLAFIRKFKVFYEPKTMMITENGRFLRITAQLVR